MNAVTKNSDDENVTVATLVRGKQYVFHHFDKENGRTLNYYTFMRAVPLPVPDEVAALLEELYDEVPDGDGELIAKDLFRIERDASRETISPSVRKRRFRMVAEDVEERPITRAPVRKPIAAAKPSGGFRRKA